MRVRGKAAKSVAIRQLLQIAAVLFALVLGGAREALANCSQTETVPANSQSVNSNQQFMCWVEGKRLVLRWVVKAPSAPLFQKSVPQGINPKQLLLDVSFKPIAAPAKVYVGEVHLVDRGYSSVHIPSWGITVPVLRANMVASDCQALCYVQSGLLITQIRTPGVCRIYLSGNTVSPLHLNLRVSPLACAGLPAAEYAVRDTADSEVVVSNSLIPASMILPVLR
jgi:hypothetical protein